MVPAALLWCPMIPIIFSRWGVAPLWRLYSVPKYFVASLSGSVSWEGAVVGTMVVNSAGPIVPLESSAITVIVRAWCDDAIILAVKVVMG